jgi:hypothetical protein
MRNGLRYLFLRDTWKHRIAGMLGYNGTITQEVLDDVIDSAMSGVGPEDSHTAAEQRSTEEKP